MSSRDAENSQKRQRRIEALLSGARATNPSPATRPNRRCYGRLEEIARTLDVTVESFWPKRPAASETTLSAEERTDRMIHLAIQRIARLEVTVAKCRMDARLQSRGQALLASFRATLDTMKALRLTRFGGGEADGAS